MAGQNPRTPGRSLDVLTRGSAYAEHIQSRTNNLGSGLLLIRGTKLQQAIRAARFNALLDDNRVDITRHDNGQLVNADLLSISSRFLAEGLITPEQAAEIQVKLGRISDPKKGPMAPELTLYAELQGLSPAHVQLVTSLKEALIPPATLIAEFEGERKSIGQIIARLKELNGLPEPVIQTLEDLYEYALLHYGAIDSHFEADRAKMEAVITNHLATAAEGDPSDSMHGLGAAIQNIQAGCSPAIVVDEDGDPMLDIPDGPPMLEGTGTASTTDTGADSIHDTDPEFKIPHAQLLKVSLGELALDQKTLEGYIAQASESGTFLITITLASGKVGVSIQQLITHALTTGKISPRARLDLAAHCFEEQLKVNHLRAVEDLRKGLVFSTETALETTPSPRYEAIMKAVLSIVPQTTVGDENLTDHSPLSPFYQIQSVTDELAQNSTAPFGDLFISASAQDLSRELEGSPYVSPTTPLNTLLVREHTHADPPISRDELVASLTALCIVLKKMKDSTENEVEKVKWQTLLDNFLSDIPTMTFDTTVNITGKVGFGRALAFTQDEADAFENFAYDSVPNTNLRDIAEEGAEHEKHPEKSTRPVLAMRRGIQAAVAMVLLGVAGAGGVALWQRSTPTGSPTSASTEAAKTRDAGVLRVAIPSANAQKPAEKTQKPEVKVAKPAQKSAERTSVAPESPIATLTLQNGPWSIYKAQLKKNWEAKGFNYYSERSANGTTTVYLQNGGKYYYVSFPSNYKPGTRVNVMPYKK